MKKTVALAILGLGVAAVNTAVAQGHVSIWSYYVAPYNQVVWEADGMPVNDTDVSLTIMYGAGSLNDPSALDQTGPIFAVNPAITYGGGGYADPQVLVTPDVGLYTIMIVAGGGDNVGMSSLFEVTTTSTALPVGLAPISPGLSVAVPEPTTFALAGLGAAALLIFRRKS